MMHMQTTPNIDDFLLNEAARLPGVKEIGAFGTGGPDCEGECLAPRKSRRNREAPSPDSETTVQQDGMILVDTSVWIQHFRVGSERWKALLRDERPLPSVCRRRASMWDIAEACSDSGHVESFTGGSTTRSGGSSELSCSTSFVRPWHWLGGCSSSGFHDTHGV
jgi:hypothetical protein